MRIFVYEYLSSGAAGDAADLPSLRTEGWAMLAAVLEDLGRCPGIETITLLDPRRNIPADNPLARTSIRAATPSNEEKTFRALAAAADYSLVIAPEFDGILEQRCRWVEEERGRLLGPSTAAIRLTADKLTLACHWRKHGIPTPEMCAFGRTAFLGRPDGLGSPSYPRTLLGGVRTYPLVVKPRYGAGSQATFLVHDDGKLVRSLQQARAEGWSSQLILQRYCPGLPVSVAFLANGKTRHALPAVEQRLSGEGRFRYLGGRLPLPESLDRRARCLAERAAASVEGLHGWFGVDLILGAAEDGSGDRVIEINPRLTTSYLGLRSLARFNLAERLLAVVSGSPAPPWDWRSDPIVFEADGRTDK